MGQTDKRGLGHNVYSNVPTSRKELTQEIKKITEEEMIPHILSLSQQSKWTQWDQVIDLDLKWKEILYGMSPSMLSFIVNSIQNTLSSLSISGGGRYRLKPTVVYVDGRTLN